MSKTPIFISFDVEADGPSPATNTCLQIALVACVYDEDPDPKHPEKWTVSSLDLCFKPQVGKQPDNETMTEFWSQFPEILEKIRANAVDPFIQMKQLSNWLYELSEQYTIDRWVAAPSAYDWQWVNYMYYHYKSINTYKLPFKSECMSSIIAGLGYMGYKSDVSQYIKKGAEHLPHTHYALEDATEQAYKYLRLRKFMKSKVY